MEKAGTPNRMTRSSARNTPAKKSEDSIDNPAEELKTSLRKSRRKNDSNSRTNGDTSTDLDSKKLKNFDEVSDCNSMDSADSNISSKQKCTTRNKNNKQSSPTISRKSLRSRRSITPGPEVEPELPTRRLRRSTSEGKLESLGTPTRRGTRAQSESKDFVFTPTKHYNNDSEPLSHLEGNSKCVPINSTLRVIDEIVEEENEHESPKRSKTSPTKHSTLDVVKNLPLVDISEDQNYNNHDIVETEKALPKNNITSDQGKLGTAIDEKQELSVNETADTVPEGDVSCIKKCDRVSLLLESQTNFKTSHQLINLEETSVNEANDGEKTNEKILICDEEQSTNKESKEIPTALKKEPIKETSFNLSISDELETESTQLVEDMVKDDRSSCDKQTINSQGEAGYKIGSPKKNLNSSIECNHSVNIDSKGNDNSSLPENNHVTVTNENSDENSLTYQNESSKLIESNNEACTLVIDGVSSMKPADFENPHSSSENIVITDNNNLCLLPEVKNENEKVIPDQQAPASGEIPSNDQKTMSSPMNLSESKPDDRIDQVASVVICGSDSEEAAYDVEENHGCTEIVYEIDKSYGQESETIIENVTNISDQNASSKAGMVIIGVENSEIQNNECNPGKNVIDTHDKDVDPFKETDDTDFVSLEQQSEKVLLDDTMESVKKIVEVIDEGELVKRPFKKRSLADQKESLIDRTGKQGNNQDNESSEDESSDKGSACGSDLYKNMSDFGSDVDEKKGSQYDETPSSELKSGDSEEYASTCEEEENEEEINDVENLDSDIKDCGEKMEHSGDMNYSANSRYTYAQALAIINKNRVRKYDHEDFFDMYTEELNRVSEHSGSDSDIAIVDEYIAEPEDQQQKKSNQKPGNVLKNQKQVQQSTTPSSVRIVPVPTSGANHPRAPTHIKINLKTNQKPNLPPTSIPQNFPQAYSQQGQTEQSQRNMAGMNFSQAGLYHQYSPAMESNIGPVMYGQFGSPNMQDPRMFQSHNFPRGNMFSHPMEPVQYPGGPTLKVRNMDSMCGAQASNAVTMNPAITERSMSEYHTRNPGGENNLNNSISTATMTEAGGDLEKEAAINKSSSAANPILDILKLDKKTLRRLKKMLGLDKNLEKQRNKIKMILKEEANKLGLPLKTANIENCIKRELDSEKRMSKIKGRKTKRLLKRMVYSDSSSVNSSEHSTEELDTRSDETSGGDQSSSESSRQRKINLEDGGVSVTIDTMQRKPRHRTLKLTSKHSSNKQRYNERKRAHQSSESSYEEHFNQTKRRKQCTDLLLEKSSRKEKKMTQGKGQTKKKSTVLQLKSGTFTVDPVTTASQSESDTLSQEGSEYLEELKQNMRRDLASGKNKLSNMFTKHSQKGGKKCLKRKADTAFGVTESAEHASKSKRLPADLLAKLSNEAKKSKSKRDDHSAESESDDKHSPKQRKPRKRSAMKKLKVPSAAAQKDYIPLVVGGPTQFGLQRLDKDGTTSAIEKAAKFKSDHLYGGSVKRITIMDFEG